MCQSKSARMLKFKNTKRRRAETKPVLSAALSDSDSDDVSEARLRAANLEAQQRAERNEALLMKEEPNVYAYDEVYDDMKQKQESFVLRRTEAKRTDKPKYQAALQESAALRKRNSKFVETRRIIKDRLNDETVYAESEMFMTRAYRETLEADKVYADKLKQEEASNRQRAGTGFAGFYGNLVGTKVSNPLTVSKPQGTIELVSRAPEVQNSSPIAPPKSRGTQLPQVSTPHIPASRDPIENPVEAARLRYLKRKKQSA